MVRRIDSSSPTSSAGSIPSDNRKVKALASKVSEVSHTALQQAGKIATDYRPSRPVPVDVQSASKKISNLYTKEVTTSVEAHKQWQL